MASAANVNAAKGPSVPAGQGAPPTSSGRGPGHPAPTAGHWVNVGGQWQLIHAVGPGHWVAGNKPGFKAPPKPGYDASLQPVASRNPDWTKPLTPLQVVQQATASVKSSYAPAYQDLAQQVQQENGIITKQRADNAYYQQWLDAKTNMLMGHQAQVDQTTQNLEQQIIGNTAAMFQPQEQNLVNAANARAGNVSNNAQSTAFTQTVPEMQAVEQQRLAGTEMRGAELAAANEANVGAAAANTGAYLRAGAAKEENTFQTAMTKIANTRATLSTKEVADINKEVARLQGQQIALAENNRNYNAAAQRLGIQAANTQSEIQTRTQNANTAATNAATNRMRLNETINMDNIKTQQAWDRITQGNQRLKLEGQRLGWEVAKDMYQRQTHTGPYKLSAGGATKPLTRASQNAVYNHLTTIRNQLVRFKAQFQTWGASPADAAKQAWHAVHDGRFYAKQKDGTWKWETTGASMTESDAGLLNAAFNTMPGGTGLTPGDINYLTNQVGLTDPQARLG